MASNWHVRYAAMKHTKTVLAVLEGEGHVEKVSTDPRDLKRFAGRRIIWIVGGVDEGAHHGIPGDRFITEAMILVRMWADEDSEDMGLELELLCARVRDKITASIKVAGYKNLDPSLDVRREDIIADPSFDVERDDTELTLQLTIKQWG